MFKKKNLVFFVLIFFIFNTASNSLENKILVKIENEIITTLDVNNEYKYLLTLNPSIKNSKKNDIIKLSKRSILQEKIKKIEIEKNFNNPKIPQKFQEKILQNVYSRIGLANLDDFKKYLIINNINFENVKKKLEIEALWNELIFTKYKDKIEIDNKKLKERLKFDLEKSKFNKSYDLSEIVFTSQNKKELSEKYKIIVDSINEISFKNTANIYSISDSSKFGGSIGWVGENQLSKIILNELKNIKEGQFTKPIGVTNGFLLLKINKIKNEEVKLSLEEELDKLIVYEKNRQLNQFSSVYFKKIKNNTKINEY